MTGVEILSSETIYNTFVLSTFAIAGAVLGIICLIIFFIISFECGDRFILSAIFGVLGLIGITIGIFGCVTNTNSIDYIEYKVIIEDSVPMNEFLNKYEILDQEGRIYTVKEIN